MGNQAEMADCGGDYTSIIRGNAAGGGGIYDFSGTQGNHVYFEEDISVTPAEIADWVKQWWDGKSDSWTTDKEWGDSRKNGDFQLFVGGEEYRVMRRATFGEGDKQHIVFGRSKDKDKKTGCVIAHSDYTVTVAVYDEEQNQRDGALSVQVQQLMMAYKSGG